MRLILLLTIALAITYTQSKAAPTELAIELIKHHEGYSNTLYKDRGGYAIGYGTNISRVSKDEAIFLLHHRLNKADMHLSLHYDWYNHLPYVPQSIVLDLFYNMGSYKFSKFRKMHYQLSKGNYVKAALELRDSNYYKQTKSRAKRLYIMLVNYKD